jgi:hypothetical protein
MIGLRSNNSEKIFVGATHARNEREWQPFLEYLHSRGLLVLQYHGMATRLVLAGTKIQLAKSNPTKIFVSLCEGKCRNVSCRRFQPLNRRVVAAACTKAQVCRPGPTKTTGIESLSSEASKSFAIGGHCRWQLSRLCRRKGSRSRRIRQASEEVLHLRAR